MLKLNTPLSDKQNPLYPVTQYNQIIMPNGSRWNGEINTGAKTINANLYPTNGNIELHAEDINGIARASNEEKTKREGVRIYKLIMPNTYDLSSTVSFQCADSLYDYEGFLVAINGYMCRCPKITYDSENSAISGGYFGIMLLYENANSGSTEKTYKNISITVKYYPS